jgi:hypothetical protein
LLLAIVTVTGRDASQDLLSPCADGAHPHRNLTLILLALVAAAFGGQSVWALRIHQTTTYLRDRRGQQPR